MEEDNRGGREPRVRAQVDVQGRERRRPEPVGDTRRRSLTWARDQSLHTPRSAHASDDFLYDPVHPDVTRSACVRFLLLGHSSFEIHQSKEPLQFN